jgi:hypothetical protein
MTIQLGILSFVQELKIILSDKGGENLQVCFPSKSAVKRKRVKNLYSIEKNPWKF